MVERERSPLEGFLDEIITWREVGYGFCYHIPNHLCFASLPDWAKTTLDAHAADPRPVVYTLEQFRDAQTHDEIWNAVQRQLVREGRMHNYLRMLWGKKILHWSSSPQQALEIMTELNNRFALDGRDPNVSGIFWTLGRFDRVGAGAACLRQDPLHDEREHAPKAPAEALPGAARGAPCADALLGRRSALRAQKHRETPHPTCGPPLDTWSSTAPRKGAFSPGSTPHGRNRGEGALGAPRP